MAVGKALIAGSSGVVGQAAVKAFAAAGWDVIALSRRAPDLAPSARWRHVALDLLDVDACNSAAQAMSGVTHVVYAALYEKPGLVAGWRDDDQMATNSRCCAICSRHCAIAPRSLTSACCRAPRPTART